MRAAQRGLTRLLRRDLLLLRRLLDPGRLQATVPPWMDAVTEVVARYSQTSATLAADFYDGEREAAGVPGTFTVPLADPPPDEQVDASLRWATKDLWPRDDDATVAQMEPLDARLEAAMAKADAAAQKLVADGGRETLRQAVKQDRQAVGYARAAALGACAFCRLMASRGMVYKTAGTAGQDANERFSGDASVAKFHNDCHCAIIPVFRGQRFQLSPHAAEWDRLYREYAQGHPGDQLRLFRRAIAEHG
ncbi:VG15 protein [Streptomyces sp. NPDC004082]